MNWEGKGVKSHYTGWGGVSCWEQEGLFLTACTSHKVQEYTDPCRQVKVNTLQVLQRSPRTRDGEGIRRDRLQTGGYALQPQQVLNTGSEIRSDGSTDTAGWSQSNIRSRIIPWGQSTGIPQLHTRIIRHSSTTHPDPPTFSNCTPWLYNSSTINPDQSAFLNYEPMSTDIPQLHTQVIRHSSTTHYYSSTKNPDPLPFPV